MNLAQTIYLTLAAVSSIIGIHQSFYYGIGASYFLFMCSIAFLMLFRHNRAKQQRATPQTPVKQPKNPIKPPQKKKR